MVDPIQRSVATTTSSTGATATSATGNLASTITGDLNVLVLTVASATATDPGVPTINGVAIDPVSGNTNAAGWTTLFTRNDSSASSSMPRLTVVARIRQASDSGSTIAWGWANGGNHVAGGTAYQAGTFNATSIATAVPDAASQEQVSSSTSFPAPSLTTSVRGLQVVIGGNRTSGTWTAPSGDTLRTSAYSTSSANFFMSDSGSAADPATFTKTATFSAATSVGMMGIINIASATGGATASTNIAFRAGANNSNNSTTPSITVPASCQSGDVLVIELSVNNTDTYTSAPAGVTLVDTDTTTAAAFPNRLFTAVVNGSSVVAGSTLNWGTLSAVRAWELVLYAASGVDTANPILTYMHKGVTSGSMTTASMPSVTTSADSWLLEIGSGKSNPGPITTWTAPSGWTVRQQVAAHQTYAGSAFIADRDSGSVVAGSYGGETYTADQAFNSPVSYVVALQPGSSNIAPTAHAGFDIARIEAFETVILSGALSADVDGSIASYNWTQVSGTSVTLTGATTVSPTFQAPATLNGDTLVFRLVVTDNNGAVSTPDTVSVTILPNTIWRLDSGGPTPMQVIPL